MDHSYNNNNGGGGAVISASGGGSQFATNSAGSNVISNRIAVIKLKRIEELNNRLKETLRRERIPASNSCLLLINHMQETPDYLIPYMYKLPIEQNKFLKYQNLKKV
ncbi:hypothetical protein DFJ63DRAFT_68416 [Scheffersomyces coipomensis]|uniref:uncharacterized protein n=1 Tax=Scheffersomyces coipomensis TaxID=1788519 RepID=UPI00315CD26F